MNLFLVTNPDRDSEDEHFGVFENKEKADRAAWLCQAEVVEIALNPDFEPKDGLYPYSIYLDLPSNAQNAHRSCHRKALPVLPTAMANAGITTLIGWGDREEYGGRTTRGQYRIILDDWFSDDAHANAALDAIVENLKLHQELVESISTRHVTGRAAFKTTSTDLGKTWSEITTF